MFQWGEKKQMRWSALHFDLAQRSLGLAKAQRACDQMCICNRVIKLELVLDPLLFEQQVYAQFQTRALGGVLAVRDQLVLQYQPIKLYDLGREFYRILCHYYPESAAVSWEECWQEFSALRQRLRKQCRQRGKRWVPKKCRVESKLEPILEAERRLDFPFWLPYEQLIWQLEQFPRVQPQRGIELDLVLE